ncbi:MAG: DNA polymerase III subunit gamma/tau [Pyrinomonadaceae bacterium]
MSYEVIARKWRPQTFEEVTGQEAITQTLRNALEYDRLHHAYLFSGARGVGKTTTARLLAKALNCHKTEGKPNITPCRIDAPAACSSCIEISESRSLDVLEIDAASHTGVDDIRDTILEGINISPARDRFKVFIIDEVHMLSKSSFNALLKTLEEPPRNVVFIMATTELHKVPETILSRCQEFEFRTIPLQKIFDRLKVIAGSEKIDVTDDALKEIARSGEGSMRDAQSNFDQVISFSGEKIDVEDVTKALGLAGAEMLVRVLRAIAEKQPKTALMVVSDLTSRGQDLRNFCRDLLSLFRDLLIFKVSDGDPTLAESAALTPEELSEQSAHFTESDLVRFFNSLAETETKLREATQPRYVVEIGLVKLIEMRSVTAIETLLERLAALEDDETRTSVRPPSDTPEKKTLNAAPLPEKAELPRPAEPEPVELAEPPAKIAEPAEPAKRPAGPETFPKPPQAISPAFDLSFLDALDSLPDIPSEDLAHADHEWLDNAFDRKLSAAGDDLKPIPKASELLAAAIHRKPSALAAGNGQSAGTSAAAAPALEIAPYVPPVFEALPHIELPPLPAEPTEEQLLAYANASPVVRSALKVFGGTIREVRKR